jgi:Predicted AAA-ATPase
MSQFIAILYPPRFGKSLNLDMLRDFLSIDKQHLDFSGLKISNHFNVQNLRGKFPVIKLDLKNCKGDTWEEMLVSICHSLRIMIEEHKEHLSEPIINMEVFDPEDDVDYKFALEFLTYDLYKKYKREVIILIDEFDTPLHCAYKNGYYEEASSFFSTFFSAGLKGNEFLAKACLVGICTPAVLLNTVRVYNSANKEFSKHFGFSHEEVGKYIPDDPSLTEKIKDWYHGYRSGERALQVFNPYSFMCYVTSGKFESHRTSTIVLGKRFTCMTYLEQFLFPAISEFFALMNGGRIIVPRLKHVVNYETKALQLYEVLHILVLTGFLTYQANNNPEINGGGTVFIPNIEVAVQWHDEFIQSFQNILLKEASFSVFSNNFHNSLSDFNVSLLQETMQEFLRLLYTTGDQREDAQTAIHYENAYHTFFLSAFKATFASKDSIEVKSYRESGNGVFGISIKFQATAKKAVFIEFNRSFTKEALNDDAEIAHQQIIDRTDFSWLRGNTVWLIGVSFSASDMSKLVTSIVDVTLESSVKVSSR